MFSGATSWVALMGAMLSNLSNALRNVLIVEKIGPGAARSTNTHSNKWLSTSGASSPNASANRLTRLIGGSTKRRRRSQVPQGGLATLAPGDTFRLLTLIGALLLIPAAAIMERDSWPRLWRGATDLFTSMFWGKDLYDQTPGDVPRAVVAAAEAAGRIEWSQALRHALVCGFSFNIFYDLCFRLLGQLHPVTHAVGNTFKRVFVIGAGAAAFGGDMGGTRGLLGTSLAVFGVFIYSVTKAVYEPRPTGARKS